MFSYYRKVIKIHALVFLPLSPLDSQSSFCTNLGFNIVCPKMNIVAEAEKVLVF